MPIVTGKTKLLGVIGDPIEHTRSPLMHNAALDRMGLDYIYLPFPIKAANLAQAVEGFAAIGLIGFNITIPHKQAIVPFLTEISEIAQAVGAVNTVWWTEEGWSGTNTDVEGFLAPLRTMNRLWSQEQAIVLGYGGAARAVVAGLAQLGYRKIQVVGRSPEKLTQFHQSWANATLSPLEGSNSAIDRILPQAILEIHPWDQLPSLLPAANVIVNTTPVGMAPHGDHAPLTEAEMSSLSAGTIVYDLIYVPRPTRLLALAQQFGLEAIDGSEMLVQQGAAALKIWTQQPVPVAVMREALWGTENLQNH